MRKLLITAMLMLFGAGVAMAGWGDGLSGPEKQRLTAASMNLPPIAGTWYYVDAKYGKNTYDATLPDRACSTIYQAYSLVVDGDGIAFIGHDSANTTTSFILSKPCSLAKSNICFFGVVSGSGYFGRVRITTPSIRSRALSNRSMFIVTGDANSFYNFEINNQDSMGLIGMDMRSDGNLVVNCHFIGGSTAGSPGCDSALNASLRLASANENRFKQCWIGTNSTLRHPVALQGDITIDSAGGQNFFEDCYIISSVGNADSSYHVAVKQTIAATLNGYQYFRSCMISNWYAGENPTRLASVVGSDATQNNAGIFFDKACVQVGYYQWDKDEADRTFLAGFRGAVSDSANTAGPR
jgi:hypothetical protein